MVELKREVQEQTPEYKVKVKEYTQEYNQRTEVKARIKKYKQKPEIKARIKEYNKKYRQNTEIKVRMKKYRQLPEVRARRKEYRQLPGVRAQEKEYRQRPGVKARTKEYNKEYLKNPQNKIRAKELEKKWRENKKQIKNNKCIVCGNPALDSYCSIECKKIVINEGGCSVWMDKNKYPIEWTEELRQKVRNRDNNKCMRCGRVQGQEGCVLSVHYIDADKKKCNLNNPISLCDHIKGSCHRLTIGKEHLFAKDFRSLLKELYGYKYGVDYES